MRKFRFGDWELSADELTVLRDALRLFGSCNDDYVGEVSDYLDMHVSEAKWRGVTKDDYALNPPKPDRYDILEEE